MKTLFTLCALFLAVVTDAAAQTQFYIVTKEKSNLKTSDGAVWDLELGEVFPFVRWVSASELKGLAANPADKSYALLQMDNLTLIVPSQNVRPVEEKDVAAAAMTYRQIVQESRANRQVENAEIAARPSLSDNDRFKMLRTLKNANIISSIRGNEHLSDEKIIELMGVLKKKEEEQRLRALEAEVQRLKNK